MDLSQMIRTAASLPEGSTDRRNLIAAIKVAVNPDTEDFVEWVLATQSPMGEAAVTRYLETKLGRTPDPAPAKGQSGRKTGPLEIGEKVYVDKTKNTNTLNMDSCERYHNRVAQVADKTAEGLVIQFYEGNTDIFSETLTAEKQFFSGFTSGAKSGLYRYTPKSAYIEAHADTSILFEAVYLRDGVSVDTRRMDRIEEYVNKGTLRGETRSTVYYTGTIGRFAENQQGEVYFGLVAQQRDSSATNINPTKGKLLYIGVANKRPPGWMAEAVTLGLRAP